MWARTGKALPLEIPLVPDPIDASRLLPTRAIVDFDYIPICIVPTSILHLWLHYRGVPQPKSSTRKDLIKQVHHAVKLNQPLDEDRLNSPDASMANTYVSVDNIIVLSSVEWKTDGDQILVALRDETMPRINNIYINEIFGEGKNGIR